MQAAVGSAVALLADLLRLPGHLLLAPASPAALGATVLAVAVLAAAAVAVCLASGAGLGRLSAAFPLVSRAAALREKSWSAAFMRLHDPDAAGRPRPRAPSVAPAAACP
jgi:uncharacterized protein DUF6412